jgi:hypothetical protein
MMVRFTIAAALFVLFLVGFEPNVTGNRIHEWLNLVLGAGSSPRVILRVFWCIQGTRDPSKTHTAPESLHKILHNAA